jgi:hypothetical protein
MLATRRTIVGDPRLPGLRWVLIGFSAVVFASLTYLTSYKNFFYDEWDFVTKDRPWDVNLLLLSHNGHWLTIPILVWKLLFISIGIGSHVPYEAVLLVAHVAAVLLLFALVRRRSGDLPAFAAALTLLVLGAGATDITWAFQIAFVGSVVFGLLAMLLLDGAKGFSKRMYAASGSLLLSLMCSGVGLAFLAAVGTELLLARGRRRLLVGLVLPIVAFGIWFAFYGAGLPGTPGAPCPTCAPTGFRADVHKGPIGLGFVATLANFVKAGLDASTAGIFGSATIWTPLLVIVAGLVIVHLFLQKKVPSWQIGMAAGAVAWFALVGLGRAQNGTSDATDSHYVYVGVVFLLPIVADAARMLPWRGLARPLLVGAFALCLLGNTTLLVGQAISQIDLMRTENAELQTVQVFRGAPDMDLNRGLDDVIMPQLNAASYFSATDALGSPVPKATIDSLKRLPSDAVDRAMLTLFGGALKAESDSGRSTSGLGCQNVDPSRGSTIDFRAPGGEWIVLDSAKDGTAYLSLGFSAPPLTKPLRQAALQAAAPEWIYLPDTGKPAAWQLRVETFSADVVRVCSTAPLDFEQSNNNTFRVDVASFAFGKGWSSVADPFAISQHSAKAASGTPAPNGAFGSEFVPGPGVYDVWYRARVTRDTSTAPEIILTLTDVTAQKYAASRTFAPNQAGTTYRWLQVDSNVVPVGEHLMRFQINIQATLSTDWYLDEAIMVPAGSPPPA